VSRSISHSEVHHRIADDHLEHRERLGDEVRRAELQRLQALELVRITRSHVDVLDLEGLRKQLPADMPSLQLRLP